MLWVRGNLLNLRELGIFSDWLSISLRFGFIYPWEEKNAFDDNEESRLGLSYLVLKIVSTLGSNFKHRRHFGTRIKNSFLGVNLTAMRRAFLLTLYSGRMR